MVISISVLLHAMAIYARGANIQLDQAPSFAIQLDRSVQAVFSLIAYQYANQGKPDGMPGTRLVKPDGSFSLDFFSSETRYVWCCYTRYGSDSSP